MSAPYPGDLSKLFRKENADGNHRSDVYLVRGGSKAPHQLSSKENYHSQKHQKHPMPRRESHSASTNGIYVMEESDNDYEEDQYEHPGRSRSMRNTRKSALGG